MRRIIFRIEDLDFSYSDTSVFQGFSVNSDARIIVLRGPSGCGKTTLLKLLSGHLAPHRVTYMPPTEGSCIIVQEDGLFPWLTGKKNLYLGGTLSSAQIRQHPLYFLIKDFVDRKAFRLSFGQRRKLELFRVLSRRFPLLCLDEPFNYMDPEARAVFSDYISSESMSDVLVVMTTHYDADISGLECDVFSFDGRLPVSGLHIARTFRPGGCLF
jgi:ABC-type multidrug transport system ATPase subunit